MFKELPKSVFPASRKAEAGSSAEPLSKKGKNKQRLSMEDLTELAQATAELSIQSAVDCRFHESLLTKAILAPELHAAVAAALEEGQAINRDRQNKKGEKTGSPHIRQCLVFVQAFGKALEEENKEEHKAFKDCLAAWWTEIHKLEAEDMAGEILVFQVNKPKIATKQENLGEAYAKMRIGLGPASSDFQEALVNHVKLLGWAVKNGPPPPSTKERRVRALMKGS
jgi:hypothetical protein